MRSDARKRTAPMVETLTDFDPEALADAHEDGWRVGREVGRRESTANTLAPFIALAESADRQFGSAQVITRDALWAAIAVARGEQSYGATKAACGDEGPREATSPCVKSSLHGGQHRDDAGGMWPR